MPQLTFTLNDGNKIPFLAFGTGTSLGSQDVTEPAGLALEKGFIHLDCAQVRAYNPLGRVGLGTQAKVRIQSYKNEDTLGAAIKASRKPRESLFVTTKLSSALELGETVSDSLRKSLVKMGLGAFQSTSRHTRRRLSTLL